MHRKLAAAAATVTLVLAAGPPAWGLLVGTAERPTVVAGAGVEPERPHPTTTTLARPAAEPITPPEQPKPARPAPKPKPEEPRPEVEPMRLACAAGRVDGLAAVKCEWSPSTSREFTHYVLFRQGPDGDRFEPIYRTADRRATRYVDKPIPPGLYHYRVVAMADPGERPVGASRVEEVRVPPADKPGVEAMRLECKQLTDRPAPAVGCRWSPSQSERFAGYQLWREGREAPAVVVFRTAERDVTRALDESVEPGKAYKYRVTAVDEDGRVIGSGGPVVVSVTGTPPAGDAHTP